MSRKKVVTSVCIDPEIYQLGRDEGFNFSKILQQGILDKQDPRKEKILLRNEVRYHERKINELKEQIHVLDQVEEKLKNRILDKAVEDYQHHFKVHGTLPVPVVNRYCDRLEISEEALVQYFMDHVDW